MNIKVCGISTVKQLHQLDGLNVDFAGFNFSAQQLPAGFIEPAALKEIDSDVCKVGVFADQPIDFVLQTIAQYGIEMVQLDGRETPDYCEQLAKKIQVIKTFYIDAVNIETVDELVSPYDDSCDYYAFDTVIKKDLSGLGGFFDWDKIARARIEKPFFLGGGIRPSDAEKVRNFQHPDFFGVDLSFHFDKEPGTKDLAMVLAFITGLKKLKS